jgi:hypothetical protein
VILIELLGSIRLLSNLRGMRHVFLHNLGRFDSFGSATLPPPFTTGGIVSAASAPNASAYWQNASPFNGRSRRIQRFSTACGCRSNVRAAAHRLSGCPHRSLAHRPFQARSAERGSDSRPRDRLQPKTLNPTERNEISRLNLIGRQIDS